MTPLRLLVNAIVGGFLLFAWWNLSAGFFGGQHASSGFLVQYLACFAEAGLSCWLLWLAAGRVRTLPWRVVFVTSLGLFASLVGCLPLWNQGSSSGLWFLARSTENVFGFALVGLFFAWRMKTYRFVPSQFTRKQ